MRANFNELIAQINQYLPLIDRLILSETWLYQNEIQLYKIAGYNIFSQTRKNNRSGGIILFIKENLNFSLLPLPDLDSANIIAIHNSETNLNIVGVRDL